MSAAGSEGKDDDKALETLKFNFNIESLGLVLYNNAPTQVSFSLGFVPPQRHNLILIFH